MSSLNHGAVAPGGVGAVWRWLMTARLFDRRAALCFGFAMLTAPLGALAQPPAIAVASAWTRPAAAGLNAAGYLTITNKGAQADRLLGAASSVAATVTLHESREVGGMMTMRPVGALTVPPGGSVALAPGGYHLMLEGLKHPLAAGQHAPVTLTFAHAGPLKVELEVRDGAPAAPMAGMKM